MLIIFIVIVLFVTSTLNRQDASIVISTCSQIKACLSVIYNTNIILLVNIIADNKLVFVDTAGHNISDVANHF